MQSNDLHSQFDFSQNPYHQINALWKEKTSVAESYPSMKPLSVQDEFSQDLNNLFGKLAGLCKEEAHSSGVQEEIHNLFQLFNQHFAQQYSLAAFAGLGRMYVKDQRMVEELDQYGQGLAEFLSQAIKTYVGVQTA